MEKRTDHITSVIFAIYEYGQSGSRMGEENGKGGTLKMEERIS